MRLLEDQEKPLLKNMYHIVRIRSVNKGC